MADKIQILQRGQQDGVPVDQVLKLTSDNQHNFLFLVEVSHFVLLRPSVDWMMPIYIIMGYFPSFTSPWFSTIQLLSRVRLFATPWTAARQASLSTEWGYIYIYLFRISPFLCILFRLFPHIGYYRTLSRSPVLLPILSLVFFFLR